jgi:hypothetical protein
LWYPDELGYITAPESVLATGSLGDAVQQIPEMQWLVPYGTFLTARANSPSNRSTKRNRNFTRPYTALLKSSDYLSSEDIEVERHARRNMLTCTILFHHNSGL